MCATMTTRQQHKYWLWGCLCFALLAMPSARAARDKGARQVSATIAAAATPEVRLARKTHTKSRRESKKAAKVAYRTGDTIYINRGERHGLQPGMRVTFARHGKSTGQCDVGHVAAKTASCIAAAENIGRVQLGDRVRFAASERPAAPVAKPSKKPSRADMQQARTLLDAIETQPVAFTGIRQRELVGMRSGANARARVQGWAAWDRPNRTFVRPSLDAGVRVAFPFWPGLAASSAFRVQGDALAPENERFRPGEVAEFYVWDAALRFDAPQTRWVGALGRFRPALLPGATLIDGLLLGYRAEGAAWEIGGYGGSIPNLVSLSPGLERWTLGAYAKADWSLADGLQILPRLRLALLAADDFSRLRGEAETQLFVLLSRALSLSASARLGLPAVSAQPTLDAARIDLSWSPTERLRFQVAWRTLNDTFGELDVPLGAGGFDVWASRGTHRGDFSTYWTFFDGLEIGVIGGGTLDSAFADARAYIGPELNWPRLLGDFGGVSLGHLEEPGFLSGRNSYVQTQIRPFASFLPIFWHVRANYLEHQAAEIASYPRLGTQREVWISSWVNAPLSPMLQLQGRAQGLFPMLEPDGFGIQSNGVLVDISISGAL